MQELSATGSSGENLLWWQRGTVYQIYPRSFMDSNGDGIGDLNGIREKLDYFTWLGMDAIWLSPIYPSPMADFGYDISNYTDIEPIFGTLEDFDALLQATHERGMKLLLDFVPNHTSDEHPWFVESRSSKDSPKRNWYVWRDPASNGGPPNNWRSHFGGPAWTFDEASKQYYLTTFDKKQVDLNWRDPDVQKAMFDVMRFWFDKGVDGFRIDVLWLLIKDEQFRDNPPNPNWNEGDQDWARTLEINNADQPEVHEIIRQMRKLTDAYSERVLVGEIYLPYPKLMTYYGQNGDEAHLPFNFRLIQLENWTAEAVGAVIDEYEQALPAGAWPNWVLGNHDRPRLASRVGLEQSRIGQMLLLTLRGTPTCYYGDELGMENVPVPPELTVDPRGIFEHKFSRDPVRSPMQWDSSPNAGFTTGKPWLPLAENYQNYNVAAEKDDPHSFLSLFRKLLQLRHEIPALSIGTYKRVNSGNPQVLAYLREHGQQQILVVLNFTGESQQINLPPQFSQQAEILCSTSMDKSGALAANTLQNLKLNPNEGLIISLSSL